MSSPLTAFTATRTLSRARALFNPPPTGHTINPPTDRRAACRRPPERPSRLTRCPPARSSARASRRGEGGRRPRQLERRRRPGAHAGRGGRKAGDARRRASSCGRARRPRPRTARAWPPSSTEEPRDRVRRKKKRGQLEQVDGREPGSGGRTPLAGALSRLTLGLTSSSSSSDSTFCGARAGKEARRDGVSVGARGPRVRRSSTSRARSRARAVQSRAKHVERERPTRRRAVKGRRESERSHTQPCDPPCPSGASWPAPPPPSAPAACRSCPLRARLFSA